MKAKTFLFFFLYFLWTLYISQQTEDRFQLGVAPFSLISHFVYFAIPIDYDSGKFILRNDQIFNFLMYFCLNIKKFEDKELDRC